LTSGDHALLGIPNGKHNMTLEELKMILDRLGLEVPEAELNDIVKAVRFIDEITSRTRQLKSNATEPAQMFSLQQINYDS
jgi:hypothetical protein